MQLKTAARKMVTIVCVAAGLIAMLDKVRKTENRDRKLLALLRRCTVM